MSTKTIKPTIKLPDGRVIVPTQIMPDGQVVTPTITRGR